MARETRRPVCDHWDLAIPISGLWRRSHRRQIPQRQMLWAGRGCPNRRAAIEHNAARRQTRRQSCG